MAKGIRPSDPARADYRMMLYLLRNFIKVKVLNVPSEFDHVGRAFVRVGGSWERLFKGSVADVALLRRMLKLAVKLGKISKEPSLR